MRAFVPVLLAASLSIPAMVPLLFRRRFLLLLGTWPFAAVLAITLPLSGDALWGWRRNLWAVESVLCAAVLGILLELMIRLGGARPSSSPWGKWDSVSLGGALALSGAAGLALAAMSYSFPWWSWDAYGIWLLKARIIAGTSHLPMAALVSPELSHAHADYPLAYPATLGWFMRMGQLDTQSVRIALGLGLVTASLGVWFCVRAVAHSLAAFLSVALLLGGLSADEGLIGGLGDPWLGIAGIAAVALVLGGSRRDDPVVIASAGLPLAACVLTKNEGLAVAVSATLSACLLLNTHRLPAGSLLRRVLALSIIWLAAASSWWAVMAKYDIRGDLQLTASPARLGENPEHVGIVMRAMTPYLRSPSMWPAYALLIAAAIWGIRRGRKAALTAWGYALPGVGLLTALAYVYSATPHDPTWHLETSLSRTIRLPLTLLVLAGLLGLDAWGMPYPSGAHRRGRA